MSPSKNSLLGVVAAVEDAAVFSRQLHDEAVRDGERLSNPPASYQERKYSILILYVRWCCLRRGSSVLQVESIWHLRQG